MRSPMLAMAAAAWLLVAAAAADAGTADSQSAGASVPTLEESRHAILELDERRLATDRAYAEAMLVHLERRGELAAGNAGFALGADYLTLMALMTLERRDESLAQIPRILSRRPRAAWAYDRPWWAALIFGDLDRAVEVVEVASRSLPAGEWAALRELLTPSLVWHVFSDLAANDNMEARARLAEALYRIGWPGPAEPGASDSLRSIMLEDRLERGDRTGAVQLAAGITTPDTLRRLLVLKRYDGLIEAPDPAERLRRALVDYDGETAAALAAAPGDAGRALERARLLRQLGREEEALALLEPLIRDVPAAVAADELGMWLVNEAGYALAELGRADELVALMEPLVAIPIEENGDLIGPSINYAAMLWRVGRPAEALDHAMRLEREQGEAANAYGRLWIASTIVCALADLGRAAEAAPWLERMRAQSADNESALMRAYFCLDDIDSAEALAIARLTGEDPDAAVLALQYYAGESGSERREHRWRDALRDRPAVRSALDRVGRLIELPMARIYWGSF